MIAQEAGNDFDSYVRLAEYLASFWNFEAVKKIQEGRRSREKHAFLADDEFEKSIKDGDFKNNPWIERIRKMREANANLEGNDVTRRSRRSARGMKAPTDLSYLASLAEKD
jgi:hypothetical protein